MINESEITSSLLPLNGTNFYIPDLREYAKKIINFGKSLEIRHKTTNKLISYILYYDNSNEIFVSMIWTNPEYRRQGFAHQLLQKIIDSSYEDILLKVHKTNYTAQEFYKKNGFIFVEESGDFKTMRFYRKIAIMQPYIFPYLGYFHLIKASDLFVFYDDVNYINRGWINRNKILLNGKEFMFTVPLSKASQNKLINQILLANNDKWKEDFYKKITHAYKKAPYFSIIIDLIKSVFSSELNTISDLAIKSIISVCDYLGMSFKYTKSSLCSPDTVAMPREKRLIEISKHQGYKMYINSIGGQALYTKDYFQSNGIELKFIISDSLEYNQFANNFIPNLSIIDVMMFNDPIAIKALLNKYTIS